MIVAYKMTLTNHLVVVFVSMYVQYMDMLLVKKLSRDIVGYSHDSRGNSQKRPKTTEMTFFEFLASVFRVFIEISLTKLMRTMSKLYFS